MTTRRFWHVAIAFLWAALPAIYFQYADAWNRLPVRMATHFDINGHANGWAPRETSMWFILGVTALVVLVATVLLARIRKPDASAWGVLAMFYIVLAVLYRASAAVIEYNLSGNFLSMDWAMMLLTIAVIAIILLSVIPKRDAALAQDDLIAEETHASIPFALLCGTLLTAGIVVNIFLRLGSFRVWTLIPIWVLLFACTIAGANGFKYSFRHSGLEIRLLGFRLRSIPLAQIREYDVQSWKASRGFGIRGVGASRAYVWGNRVVRIQTSDGEVFLGHSHPERVVRDLDEMKRTAQ